ncbi:cytochrome P450 [Periconia macrospinosa]|uniref:Cytochrome P450 n=1 Tax=Periconia macrospinosa TaxID=97972 RepID=A0A2V1DG27_9PLEO|nr:cytochrome P450 [Periconia macrospinosa]
MLSYIASIIWREHKSPLHSIPGPWYAPYTTMHLRWLFARGTIPDFVWKQHDKHGPIMRLGPRQVWISDMESLRQVLLTIDLPKVAMYAEISRDKNSPGLFGEIREEPHKKLRKFLNPAFSVKYVDGLDHLFQQCVEVLIRRYYKISAAGAKSFQVDLNEDLHNLALDIMGECSFGKGFGQTDPEANPQEGVSADVWKSIPWAIFTNISRRYQTVYLKKTLRLLGLNLKFDWSPAMVKAIDATVKVRANNLGTCTHRPDLLQHVVEEGMRPDTGVKMSTRDIVDQMSEILLAGAETTSGTLTTLFIELARNPMVKARLFETLPALGPLDEIIGGKRVRSDPTFDYLNACISETLRMHPIASEMGRRTGKEWVKLMDFNLPPHTVVSASYRKLHYNPQYWPEPFRFWPERFLPDKQADGAPKADTKAYFPFSAGKHSCIGINFAWNEMRVVAANILARYDIQEVLGQDVTWRQYITIQITDGHWKVVLIPRSKSSTPQATCLHNEGAQEAAFESGAI